MSTETDRLSTGMGQTHSPGQGKGERGEAVKAVKGRYVEEGAHAFRGRTRVSQKDDLACVGE